mgnify:CR=1 FL=1
MRVLMISDHADPLAKIGSKESGGQNVYVMSVASLLAKRGHRVDVYTRWDCPTKQEVVQVNPNLRVVRVNAGPRGYMPRDDFLKIIGDFTAGIKERIELEALAYDVIFSNYWFSGIIGLSLAKDYGIPQTHVYHSIGQIRYQTLKDVRPEEVDNNLFRVRAMWERRLARECASIITTSPVEQADIQRLFRISRDKIICLPIGVDLRQFRPRSQARARKKLGLGAGPLVLYVGRIEWRKGIGTLIQALAKLPDAELCVVGGGTNKEARKLDAAERKRLQSIANDLGLKDRVHFVGAKQPAQVALYYAAADVCAVPSYYEPFGIVPIEAMACGTPVVASHTGGMRFTVREGITGHLAKTNDHEDLAAKLALVLQRGRDAYAQAARTHIQQQFAWPKIAVDTIAHLITLSMLMKGMAYEDSTAGANRRIGAAQSLRGNRASSLQSL